MAINKVELCGVNTSRLPVLNAEEKETLLKKAREGDAAARERYIQGNLRLVLSVIKRFSNSSENADDLFQIGCIGLITPPVGTVQNVVAGVGRLRMEVVIKGTSPFLIAYILLAALLVMFPQIVTAPLKWMH